MPDEYRTFLYNYPFQGARCSFEIRAKDLAEADERLNALVWAAVDGEVVPEAGTASPRP